MNKITNFTHFIRVDVSKKTLDFYVLSENFQYHYIFKNSKSGLKTGFAKLKKESNIQFQNTLFCIEQTGDYTNPVLFFLDEFNASIWLEMPVKIKQSSGLNRLKTDKTDAKMIAQYAKRFTDKFIPWKAPRKYINQLKKLYSIREKINKSIVQYKSTASDTEYIIDKETKEIQKITFNKILLTLKKEKEKIESKIKEIIQDDEYLNNVFTIITSVPGIGFITAIEMIITTNEFKNISCPKKYACYAGIAPFEQSSGTALYKSRVSHLANKQAKKALHLGAMSAIVMKGELKEYYYRKLAEGKPKMSALNAVRNKIIQRAFSCIKRNKPYQIDYIPNY